MKKIQYQFTAYVSKAIKNSRNSYLKKHRYFEIPFSDLEFDDELLMPDIRHDPERVEDFNNELLMDLIYLLPQIEREILTMKYIYRYTYYEIGLLTGMRSDTANKRHQRIIAKLRKEARKEHDLF